MAQNYKNLLYLRDIFSKDEKATFIFYSILIFDFLFVER